MTAQIIPFKARQSPSSMLDQGLAVYYEWRFLYHVKEWDDCWEWEQFKDGLDDQESLSIFNAIERRHGYGRPAA